MDNEQNHTLTDLLKYSYEEKPVEFASTFNSLIGDKLEAAINAKKIEIAQSMFAGPSEYEDSDDVDQEDVDDTIADYETEAPEVEDNGEIA